MKSYLYLAATQTSQLVSMLIPWSSNKLYKTNGQVLMSWCHKVKIAPRDAYHVGHEVVLFRNVFFSVYERCMSQLSVLVMLGYFRLFDLGDFSKCYWRAAHV